MSLVDHILDDILDQMIIGLVTMALNLSWWHPVTYYLQKMIPDKTQYKTHNGKLLIIVEAFKTWWHYLKGCKHKVLVFVDYNNFHSCNAVVTRPMIIWSNTWSGA